MSKNAPPSLVTNDPKDTTELQIDQTIPRCVCCGESSTETTNPSPVGTGSCNCTKITTDDNSNTDKKESMRISGEDRITTAVESENSMLNEANKKVETPAPEKALKSNPNPSNNGPDIEQTGLRTGLTAPSDNKSFSTQHESSHAPTMHLYGNNRSSAGQYHHNQNLDAQQQCYCLMPVPSGISQTPFIYQCVPISAAVTGSIAHGLPVIPGAPGHIPSPIAMIPNLPNSNMLGAADHANNSGMHTIATTLAQMKSGNLKNTDENHIAEPSFSETCISRPPDSRKTFSAGVEKPRPHACKMQDNWGRACKRTFTRPYDLYRHQETVHGSGAKSFCCGMCGCKSKKFSRQDSLARHIRRMHRKVDPLEIRGLVATTTSELRKPDSSTPQDNVEETVAVGIQTPPAGRAHRSPSKAQPSPKLEFSESTKSMYDTESEDDSNDSDSADLSEPRSKRMKTEIHLAAQPV